MYVYTNYEPNPCKGQASEEKKKTLKFLKITPGFILNSWSFSNFN